MRLLLIEDERAFARLLQRRLESAGYAVDVAFTGPEGLDRARAEDWDAGIFDVMLPEIDGLTIVRRLREAGSRLPILMLTARDAVEDRVKGLQTGADDYLIKPFAFTELLARLEALLRRSSSVPRLRFGPVQVDVPARIVTVDGAPVELTATEFDLLAYLIRNSGRVLSRREIRERVWDWDFDAETKVVDVYVHYVRRKLADAGAPDIIETVRGVGYAVGRSPAREGAR